MNRHASVTAAHPPAACRGAAASPDEVLAFKLGDDEYGIAIERVLAIRSYEEPASLRNAPAFIKGAINLCGVIVTMVDMRLRFNLAPLAYDRSTVVIVLDIGRCAVGMVVDSVSEVTALTTTPRHPARGCRTAGDQGLAIGSAGDRSLLLIDIDTLLSDTDIGLVAPTLQ